MQDYRNNPQASPKVWCVGCKQLVEASEHHITMKTVFAVTESGIYPYAVWNGPVELKTKTYGE